MKLPDPADLVKWEPFEAAMEIMDLIGFSQGVTFVIHEMDSHPEQHPVWLKILVQLVILKGEPGC